MESGDLPGYTGRVLRVDLTTERITEERPEKTVYRRYVGGLGFGARVLYDEVPPGVEWSSPENRLILATGPLNGTRVAGSGTFCSVTKGPLTGGGASSQANGYFGAYLKLSGFDAVVIHGTARRWVYLSIHDGTAELRDASRLVGEDATATQRYLVDELGGKDRDLSAYAIGPAGEHLVRFATVHGDRTHTLGHNGVGAVMGAKKLKGFVARRGKGVLVPADLPRLAELCRRSNADAKAHRVYGQIDRWGTSMLFGALPQMSLTAVRNLTTSRCPDVTGFSRPNYPLGAELTRVACWACPFRHNQLIKLTEGPYAGLETKDPEYECAAGWGPLVGNEDFGAALMLCDLTDRLGLDSNEASWTVALVIECFERGIIGKRDTEGLEMTWGNVQAIAAMLRKIARREGLGGVLAEGTMRAAAQIGGEAPDLGVYLKRGHTPRTHDARARWADILDYATGGVGTSESNAVPVSDPFTAEGAVESVCRGKIRAFVDSLVVCNMVTMSYSGDDIDHLVAMLNAVTGWDFTRDEAMLNSLRTTNLFRAFNLRHGMTPDLEEPSTRYGSAPDEGVARGLSIMPHWDDMVDKYYQAMGWDRSSGNPLPETLRRLGLDALVRDLWP